MDRLDRRQEFLKNKRSIVLSVQRTLHSVMPDEILEEDARLFHGMKDEESIMREYREYYEDYLQENEGYSAESYFN